MDLSRESCAPCRAGSPLDPADISELWRLLSGWSVATRGDLKTLRKSFEFPDFASALAFACRLGALAEEQDHHPEVSIEWGRATVSWWTRAVGGLHRNDFICAARTDGLVRA